MNDSERKALQKGLSALGLDGNGPEASTLEKYISEIELWNPRYGLVAAGEDLVGRHILDSLSALDAIRSLSPKSLADVGSGAGFPGIPLAVGLPECRVSLIERMGRRAGFLRNAVLTLGLKNVEVIDKPVEEYAGRGSRYDVVTFRAWSAIDSTVLDSIAGLLVPGGTIAAYKGRKSVVETELSEIRDRITVLDILPLATVAGKGERHLVLLKLR